jgi:hypothetical protein
MLKDFSEIDGPQQYELMVGLLRRFADSGAPWLDALCEKESSTPDSIWEDLCRARVVEPCSVPEFLMTRRA